jgi:hypothetical protein
MRLGFGFGIIVGVAGCLDTDLALPPAVEIIGVSPSIDVAEDQPVTVAFTGVLDRSSAVKVVVWRGGQEVSSAAEVERTALLIAPAPRWPAGVELELAIEGLVDEHGRGVAGGRLAFSVRGRPESSLPAIVRTPTPGTRAPLNLGWVAVALGDPMDPPEAVLESGGVAIDLASDRQAGGVWAFRLPPFEGECRPLCPGARYAMHVQGWDSAGALSTVETSTETDDRPPEIIATKVVYRGGQPWVEICADEPILARGAARAASGVEVAYEIVPTAAERIMARPSRPLDPGTAHELAFSVEDLARNAAAPIRVPLITPPAISVVISEIVASPLRDWGDSEGGEVPFDAIPGIGAVSDADEWIELINLSEAAIDLNAAGLELRTIDGAPSITPLAGAPALYFGDGGALDSWFPGEALVVRPRGAMSSRTLIVEVAAGERILDRRVIGEVSGADHAGGSPPGVSFESIARTETESLAWCVPSPGDPLPPSDCAQ